MIHAIVKHGQPSLYRELHRVVTPKCACHPPFGGKPRVKFCHPPLCVISVLSLTRSQKGRLQTFAVSLTESLSHFYVNNSHISTCNLNFWLFISSLSHTLQLSCLSPASHSLSSKSSSSVAVWLNCVTRWLFMLQTCALSLSICRLRQHFLHIFCPQFLLAALLHPSTTQFDFLCFFART